MNKFLIARKVKLVIIGIMVCVLFVSCSEDTNLINPTEIVVDQQYDNLVAFKNQDNTFILTVSKTRMATFDIDIDPRFTWQLLEKREDGTFDLITFPGLYNGEEVSLEVGTYKFVIQGFLDRIIYSMKITTFDLPDENDEPNNTIDLAKEIALSEINKLHLSYFDEDWFKLNLDSSVLLNFDLGRIDFYAEVAVYDYKQELVHSVLTFGPEEQNSKGLLPGEYFINIKSYEQSFANRTFDFIVNDLGLPDRQFEPNNNINQAKLLERNVNYNMYLTLTEEDWFTFTLDAGDVITFEINDAAFLYSLLDEAKNIIVQDSDFYLGNTIIREAGTYYLGVKQGGSVTDLRYKVKIGKP